MDIYERKLQIYSFQTEIMAHLRGIEFYEVQRVDFLAVHKLSNVIQYQFLRVRLIEGTVTQKLEVCAAL